jgi:UDP:flavonoid glycosyltransferase YjiC (YdhE family)
MSRDLRIDFVTPPFAGHLYPSLDLARRLRDRGVNGIRILSTSGAMSAITSAGFPFVEILPGRDQQVWEIANTRNRVGSNPMRMWRQVQNNLALMQELKQQLQIEWQTDPPDLVIADFVVPVAGLTAQAMGIRWWTGMPSPCALETSDGTPAYVGGWMPRTDLMGRLRDRLGRQAVRTFKKTSAWMFSRQLKALSISSMYRADGTEVVYSPERILAYGMREFEFEQSWPASLQFIGPLTSAPPLPGPELQWEPGKKTVLVTLGTHLPWAKSQAIELMQAVSRQMPDTLFHFSRGQMGSQTVEIHRNLHLYGFIPYDAELYRYDAAIIHGGTGITYACIRNAVPMLVWPHDYDQFDHAARIVHHQLGLRLKPSADRIVSDLRTLLTTNPIRNTLQRFQSRLQDYDPGQSVIDALGSLHREATGIPLSADSGD